MSGLDNMKARILEEAQDTAKEIVDGARADAQACIEAQKDAAQAEAAGILQRAGQDASDYAARVESSLDMHRKQAILAAKQEVIRDVLDAAYDAVMNLDDEKYFELIEKLLKKYVLSGDGTICFSASDLERMPAGFAERIKDAAGAKGGTLKISEKPEKMDGGFLLVYGGIEENCTIRAVFDSKREELSDQVNRLLFG